METRIKALGVPDLNQKARSLHPLTHTLTPAYTVGDN